MNFIKGRMTAEGFETTDGLVLPALKGPATATTCGIRPEHLRLDEQGIELLVAVIEPTGSETQLVARLGAQMITGIFRERLVMVPGTTVRVSPDPDALQFFDKHGARC